MFPEVIFPQNPREGRCLIVHFSDGPLPTFLTTYALDHHAPCVASVHALNMHVLACAIHCWHGLVAMKVTGPVHLTPPNGLRSVTGIYGRFSNVIFLVITWLYT